MKKTERDLLIRTGAGFFLLFIICVIIMTGYDTMRNRKLGRYALEQKQRYLYDLLEGKDDEAMKEAIAKLKDSAKDNYNGNFQNQYYWYRIIKEDKKTLTELTNKLYLKCTEGVKEQTIEFVPDEAFSRQEFAKFEEALKVNKSDVSNPPQYRFVYEAGVDEEGNACISRIIIEKLEWTAKEKQTGSEKKDPWLDTVFSFYQESAGRSYVQTDASLFMEWKNKKEKLTSKQCMEIQSLSLPYYNDGYKEWKFWKEQDWLWDWDFSEELVAKQGKEIKFDGMWTVRGEAVLAFMQTHEEGAKYLQIRCVGRPFLSAVENLSVTYVMLAVILILCGLFVGAQQIRTERKKEQIEADRVNFLNGMAHEMRTPLAVLRMCNNNLRVPELSVKWDYYLDMADRKTGEMDEMLRQMMYLSRLSSVDFTLKPQKAAMEVMVGNVLNDLYPVIEEKELHIIYHPKEVQWQVDIVYFRQLIFNLISNAVEYTKEQGNIWIVLEDDLFSVENEGNPISAEHKAELFELFAGSRQLKGGIGQHTGFGLYLVKQVAVLHQMQCEVENTKNGPLFKIFFS